MKLAAGQAVRTVHRAIRIGFGLLLAGGLAAGVLGWRLAQGPLPLPWLARLVERELAPPGRLEIGDLALAWQGWSANAAPVELRFTQVVLRDASGALRAAIPAGEVDLSLAALTRARLRPATITLIRPALLLHRTEAGGLGLGPDTPLPEDAAAAGPEAALAGLLRPLEDAVHAALRLVRIEAATVLVVDPQRGRNWTLAETGLELRRDPTGRLAATGSGVIRSEGLAVPVQLRGEAQAGPLRLLAEMSLPSLAPAELAGLLPDFAPLAALDAPVALVAAARFGPGLAALEATARLVAGPGRIDLAAIAHAAGGEGDTSPAPAWLAFDGIEATLAQGPARFELRRAALRLPGGAADAAPTLVATGAIAPGPAGWGGRLQLEAAPADLPTLLRHWPEVLAPAARTAVLDALPAGQLAAFAATLTLAPPAGSATVPVVAGDLTLRLAAVRLQPPPWLEPVALDSVTLAARFAPGHAVVERLEVRLPAGVADPGPVLVGTATATRGDTAWSGEAALSLDRLVAADLPGHWPRGMLRHERNWFTNNVTAGEVRNGSWRLGFTAPVEAPLRITPVTLTGTATASGATVHWLRPIPPVAGAQARIEFGLDAITIHASGGRQLDQAGRPTPLELRGGTLRFVDFDRKPQRADFVFDLAGPLPETLALLRHPRLKLFEARPLEITPVAGRAEARLTVRFPLLDRIPPEAVVLGATARIIDGRFNDMLLGRPLEAGQFELAVDQERLVLNGQARMVGVPARIDMRLDFRPGPPTQVIERIGVVARPDARDLGGLDLDPGEAVSGPLAVTAELRKLRNGDARVVLGADLVGTRLGLDALGWVKPPGVAGRAAATLRLRGREVTAIEAGVVEGGGLLLRGGGPFVNRPGGAVLGRLDLTEGRLGDSRFTGTARPPEAAGGPWRVALRGPVFDLGALMSATTDAVPAPARPGPAAPQGVGLALDLGFDRVRLGPGRELGGVTLAARVDGAGLLRSAESRGQVGVGTAGEAGGFTLSVRPEAERRRLLLSAEDAGALLGAFAVTNSIRGGRLTVDAAYAEARPGATLAGIAEIEGFAVADAPAIGKLLQAATLYGLFEAVQGGDGLLFNRLVAPFTLSPETLLLGEARAYSASLGLTARGRIARQAGTAELEGTIVPAYALNSALGQLPVIGPMFRAERGGGLFAMTWRLNGALGDPTITVNPLAALTPGFLRGLFGGGAAR